MMNDEGEGEMEIYYVRMRWPSCIDRGVVWLL